MSTVPPPVTQVMQEAQAWLPPRLAAVERRLGELVGGHGEMLAGDAGATLAAGGKRMRPLLVLLCAGPRSGASAVRAATAVELVHMATLVHDDVLDGASMRRGHPTVAARSGRARAVATGDLLFSRAFAELGTNGARRQVQLLSAASVALAVGELAQRRDAFDASISPERYLKRCLLKTARLFECACVIGSAGEADRNGGARDDEGLAVYGRHIGLAFQLLDDVLDVTGPPERTGKPIGTDLLDGTVTLPLILAREAYEGLADVNLSELDEEGAAEVCRRIAATDALDRVREMARHRVEDAKESLVAAGVSEDRRRLLDLVADGVVERYS